MICLLLLLALAGGDDDPFVGRWILDQRASLEAGSPVLTRIEISEGVLKYSGSAGGAYTAKIDGPESSEVKMTGVSRVRIRKLSDRRLEIVRSGRHDARWTEILELSADGTEMTRTISRTGGDTAVRTEVYRERRTAGAPEGFSGTWQRTWYTVSGRTEHAMTLAAEGPGYRVTTLDGDTHYDLSSIRKAVPGGKGELLGERVDAHTIRTLLFSGGTQIGTNTWQVSADGSTLTATDVSAARPGRRGVTVYRRAPR